MQAINAQPGHGLVEKDRPRSMDQSINLNQISNLTSRASPALCAVNVVFILLVVALATPAAVAVAGAGAAVVSVSRQPGGEPQQLQLPERPGCL